MFSILTRTKTLRPTDWIQDSIKHQCVSFSETWFEKKKKTKSVVNNCWLVWLPEFSGYLCFAFSTSKIQHFHFQSQLEDLKYFWSRVYKIKKLKQIKTSQEIQTQWNHFESMATPADVSFLGTFSLSFFKKSSYFLHELEAKW